MEILGDIRIIAIEQFGAGPYASVHLADLGAEVIKIEDPRTGGDVGRYVPPYQQGTDSLFFQTFNRNKRSISLDLTTEAGRSVFEHLVGVSDVVHSNLRGDVPSTLGITYDDLKSVNPRIVCSSLSGYGMTGPKASEPGYDYLIQGEAGWMSITGEPDGPPTKSGLSLVDFSGGLVAAIAILAGVHAARRDGVGMDCDLSLHDVALNLLTYPATWHLTEGFLPERRKNSAHPSLVPFQNFQTSDGWIVVACAKEKFWQRLAGVLESYGLADNPQFSTFEARRAHASTLLPVLEEAFLSKGTEEWLQALREAGVPCGPVLTVDEALQSEHTVARRMIVATEHPVWGEVRQVVTPVRVGDISQYNHHAAPSLNQDATYVLEDLLGYDGSTIEELRSEGAFG